MQEKPINSAHESPFHSEMIENFDQLDQQTALSLRDDREFRSTRPTNCHIIPSWSRKSSISLPKSHFPDELIEFFEQLAPRPLLFPRDARKSRSTRPTNRPFTPRCSRISINSAHELSYHPELIEKFEHRRIRATCGLFPHKKTDRPFPDDPIKRSNKDRFQKAAANTSRPNRQPTPLAQSGGRRRSP